MSTRATASTLVLKIVGMDTSESSIANAQQAYSHVKARVGSVYDDLGNQYGVFPLVVSLKSSTPYVSARLCQNAFLA